MDNFKVSLVRYMCPICDGAPLIAHFSKYIRSLKDGTRFCFIDELAGKKIGLWN